MMKGITLYEPYASLMMIGAKQNETRPMRTFHRGDICIHAAMKDAASPEICSAAIKSFEKRGLLPTPVFGCIVAVVDLWDVQPTEKTFLEKHFDKVERGNLERRGYVGLSDEEWSFGNYSEGRFFYRTRNLRRLKTPIPAKGFQCVGWTLPADIEAKVRAQL